MREILFCLVMLSIAPAYAGPIGAITHMNQSLRTDTLKKYKGVYFSEFAKAEPRYNVLRDKTFNEASEVEMPGELHQVGNTTLLTFEGCRAHMCGEIVSLVVIDTATGEFYAQVWNDGAVKIIVPNIRLQRIVETQCRTISCE